MMRKIGNNELDLARETLGLEEWDKIHATRAGFRFEDGVSGLEIVAPRFYHVGVDHRLMNPASLLPDSSADESGKFVAGFAQSYSGSDRTRAHVFRIWLPDG